MIRAIAGRHRVLVIFAAIALSCLPLAAEARCPPKRSEAQVVAEGGVVFTGRVVALGPRGDSPFPAYADLDRLDDMTGRAAGPTLRVHAQRNGIYTASFEIGAIYRVAARRGGDGLSTSGCDLARTSLTPASR